MILQNGLPCVIRHPETKVLCGKRAFVVPDDIAVGPVCPDCTVRILAAWTRDAQTWISQTQDWIDAISGSA